MNNFLLMILSLIFTSFLGYFIIRGFNLIKNGLFAFSCAFGLGIGLIYYQLFIYSRLNISWNIFSIILPWILFLIILFIFQRKNFSFKLFKINKLTKTEVVLIILISLITFYTVFEAVIRPTVTWDSWATWLVESKAYFYEGKILPETIIYFKSEYPLLLKLNWVFNFIFIGEFDDTAILLSSSAFYIFLLLAFFSSLKNKTNTKIALLFTFLLATTQVFVRQGGRLEAGQADLPLGYFMFLSSIFLIDYVDKSKEKSYLLLNIFIACATLTKVEGLPFAIIVQIIAIYHIYVNKLYFHLKYILFWIVPFIDWRLFRFNNNFENYYREAHPFEFSIIKSKRIIYESIIGALNIKSWNLLWITYLFSLFTFGLKRTKVFTILNILIISQIIIYLMSYFFFFGNAPDSSWERLLAHIAPIALFYVALQFSEIKNIKRQTLSIVE